MSEPKSWRGEKPASSRMSEQPASQLLKELYPQRQVQLGAKLDEKWTTG
jgi:hypothetical protein